MKPVIVSLVAAVLYLIAAALKARQIKRADAEADNRVFLSVASIALVLHGIGIYNQTFAHHGAHLGFFHMSSLIFWFITGLTISGFMRRKPIDNVAVMILPLASLAIFVGAIFPHQYEPKTHLTPGILTHIIISVLAYSMLSIASLQALTLMFQESQLRKKHSLRLVMWLPPLQTMEEILFELIWIGFILLSAAILSGTLFLDDMFAQHLAHKTIFSIIAWLIFATLLTGHHRMGWRGKTAVRWTLWGFAALMLAYFGSKFVLELILQRG